MKIFDVCMYEKYEQSDLSILFHVKMTWCRFYIEELSVFK